MIRRFILAEDNIPKVFSESIDYDSLPTNGSGQKYYTFNTGPISWAIVTQSNAYLSSGANIYYGPYYSDGLGSSTAVYSLTDFSDGDGTAVGGSETYDTNTLMVFYNGQLLVSGVDYEENNPTNNGFTLQTGGAAFTASALPDSTDKMMIVYASGESSAADPVLDGRIGIQGNVTPGDTSVTLTFEGSDLTGKTLQVNLIVA